MKRAVLIADDHPVIRMGLKALLADCDDMECAGEAADGHATIALTRRRDWDLLVMDLPMPGRNGLELIKLVRCERPRLPIMVFTDQREEMFAVRAIRAGAMGYIAKRAEAGKLLAAMRRVADGHVDISDNVAELLATDNSRDHADHLPHTRLTDREFGIFARIVNGAKLTEIAGELSLSIKTISTHKANILDKMTLTGQVQLVRYAIEHKLLDAAQG